MITIDLTAVHVTAQNLFFIEKASLHFLKNKQSLISLRHIVHVSSEMSAHINVSSVSISAISEDKVQAYSAKHNSLLIEKAKSRLSDSLVYKTLYKTFWRMLGMLKTLMLENSHNTPRRVRVLIEPIHGNPKWVFPSSHAVRVMISLFLSTVRNIIIFSFYSSKTSLCSFLSASFLLEFV